MFVMKGTIVFFSWILLNLITGSKGVSATCAEDWEVAVSKDLGTSWTGNATEGSEIDVEISSTLEDCPGSTGPTSFEMKNSLPLRNPCSNTAYNVKINLICDGNVDSTREFVIWTPPAAPSNVRTESVASTSFRVSWDPPPRDIAAYRVEINGTINNETSSTSQLITKLKPNTWYRVKVSAKGKEDWSEWSDAVSVKTLDIPVLILRNGTVYNTSISISWDHPQDSVTLFSVRWTEDGSQVYKHMNVTVTSYTIEDLIPYTFYNIQASAWIENKMGSWSDMLRIQTAPGIPFPPKNLKEGNKTSRSVEVLWEEPEPSRGPIIHYNIWCRSGKQKRSLKILQTNDTHYWVDGLNVARKYIISVKAVTVAGGGNWSDLNVKTLSEKPYPPNNVSAISETPNSINVTWESPGEYTGKILMYTMLWEDLGTNNVHSDNTTNLFYFIQSLKPYSNFSIQVRAWTDAGPGNWSERIEARTAAGVPSSPRDITASKITDTSIYMKWQDPVPYVGPIVQYYIQWKNVNTKLTVNNDTKNSNYLIENLDAFTEYEISVQAETTAGRGEWAEPVLKKTSVGVPYSPRELKVTNITDTSIRIEWKAPQPFVGPIVQYNIIWTNKRDKIKRVGSTVNTVFLIQGLQPFTNYTIVVQAKTDAGPGELSKPILERTGIGVPTSPRNVKVKTITDKSIHIEWQEPDPYVGPIIQYSVMWINKKNNFSKSRNTPNSDFLIQDLDPFTNYMISVRAETAAGIGVWSNPKEIRTEIGVPSAPRDIKSSKISDTSIHIDWKDPIPYVGPIVRYHVQWKNLNSSQTVSDVTENSSYLVKNLDAFTQYEISVQAETSAGPGDWSQPVQITTEVGVPTIPRNIKTTPLNTSIAVTWEQPEPSRGPIQYYTIRWRNHNVNNEGITNTTNYVIRNLMPFTSYFIQVKATTSAGGSLWTDAMEVKTLTGIPSTPRNVTERDVTETSILLEWQEPIPNVGLISRYLLMWRNMNNNLIEESFTDKSPFLIQKLNPFTNYTIMVKAETSAGLGAWSEPLLVRTNIAVPSPPRDVKLGNVANTSIEMMWNEPHPKVGDILEYLVIWTDVKSGKKEAGKTINLFYAIESLEPYTNYSIAVSAKTEAGMGNSSSPLNVRTRSGVPLAPEKLQKVKVTNRSIEIKWEEPKLFKGPIISYTIRWMKETMNEMKETKQPSYVIPNLSPYTWYNISVNARTEAGFGNWSDNLELQTDIGIPSIPQNLTVTEKKADSVSLTWKEPENPNGPLLKYKLNWYASDAFLSSIEINDTFHQVSDLLPYTEYKFLVTAYTKAGWSNPSSEVKTRTNVAVPSKAKILSVEVKNSSSVVTEWETEAPYPGPTRYEILIWKWPNTCDEILSNVLETALEGQKSREEWQHRSLDVVESLPPYLPFSVQIVLKTEAGEKASDESSMKWTPPKAPGPPSDVTADCKKKSTEAQVQWSVPKNPNGKITEYLVEYGTEFLGFREKSVKVNNECVGQRVWLSGLRPEREYKIYVRAKTKDVSTDGERAAVKESCTLPAGVPPLGNKEHVTVEASGPHHLVIKWNDVVFSDAMGSLVEYSVIVGLSGAVEKAESGVFPDVMPTWLNFSSGMSDVYQATPPDWNPFNEDGYIRDPLNCRILLDVSRHKTLQCVLGLESECSKNVNRSFCNGPLTPDTKYGVKLRAYTRGGYSETAPVFATTAPMPGSGGLVGGLVGTFFVLLLIGIIVFGVIIVKKRGGMPYVHKIIAPHLSRLHKEPTEHPPQPDPVVEMETYEQGRCINILNFSDHVRLMMSDSHLRFSEEFDTLKLNSPKYNCASAEMDENRLKNRWMNIYPYDHSRVKLLPLGDEPASDFINANYIPGDSSLREYIASQGPLPHTVDDFWRMIWEQSSTMIVMLTQCVERGKVKCEQYWPPPGEARHYGDIQVRSLSESMLSSYTIRLFHVQLGSYDRRVKQLHFTRWPDFGCPESPEDLINFVRAVRDHLPQIRPGPILVHCSAGVGRTGTFITVDRLMQQLKHSSVIDIYSTVLELRHHRINMVQTEDQYIYIHLCVQQLVREITQPSMKGSEEAIYSNLGVETETGL